MPTDSDWIAFGSISVRDKAAVLYVYLGLNGFNMQEVAQHALGNTDDQASQRVSLITRCYGFSGRNSGKFVKLYANAFKGKNQSEIDGFKLADIQAFVQTYPNGGTTPEDMENFLRECISARLNDYDDEYYDDEDYDEPSPPPQYRQPQQRYQQPQQRYRQPQQRYQQPQQSAYINSSSGSGGYGGGGGGFRGFELPDINWGVVVAVIIVIGIGSVLFGKSCGGSASQASTCLPSVSASSCVPAKEMNVNFDVGYFSDGTFDNAMIVVDDRYYNYLDANVTNKFAAELKKGKHTVCIEYYRNGTAYATDSLEFKINKKDELVDLLVYPYGEKLVLVFSDT